MDFEKILHAARKNELNRKEPVRCLQTKFKAPSKEQREKDRVLSEGVQRFLARKEEEERLKQKEAERRKQELMALRAKDPKANRRVQTMLKRTKSANKSVMEDAVDTNNTADTLAGPSQPDEDDYGFVSETSSQLYNKLIQKMYSTPSDDLPKFAPSKKPNGSNLMNTKERVKMALLKQEEEEKLPHRRKRKGSSKKEDEENDNVEYGAPDRDISSVCNEKGKGDPPRIKKTLPPPLDFHELLKIAEKKQHEPIVFEKEKKTEEPEVLMTKKQKLEFERMQEWKRKRELGLLNPEDKNKNQKDDKGSSRKIPKLKQSSTIQRVPKVSGNYDDSKECTKIIGSVKERDLKAIQKTSSEQIQKRNSGERISKLAEKQETNKKYKDISDETERLIKERDEALRILKEKERLIRERDEAVRKLKEKEQLIRERDEAVRKLKLLEKADRINKNIGKSNNSILILPSDKTLNSSGGNVKLTCNVKSLPNKTESVSHAKFNVTNGSSQLSKVSSKMCNMPSQKDKIQPRVQAKDGYNSKCHIKKFPPTDLRSPKKFPPADVRRKPIKRRRLDSDDDEYDPEMADFIDDGEADVGPEDVSRVISEIFRYNKNGYSHYDDDDGECMESNFAQISKEEFYSTKCGILEDLEDIQKKKAALARRKKR